MVSLIYATHKANLLLLLTLEMDSPFDYASGKILFVVYYDAKSIGGENA
jgi:hypothetical protein